MLNKLLEIIETPMKAAITTVTGLITGYIPSTVNDIAEINNNKIDMAFQYIVWSLTILVAITALITWTQKQIEQYKKRHAKK